MIHENYRGYLIFVFGLSLMYIVGFWDTRTAKVPQSVPVFTGPKIILSSNSTMKDVQSTVHFVRYG